jgi:hypothetical protein
MDKPADPSTPFGEVYQSFLDDLARGWRRWKWAGTWVAAPPDPLGPEVAG